MVAILYMPRDLSSVIGSTGSPMEDDLCSHNSCLNASQILPMPWLSKYRGLLWLHGSDKPTVASAPKATHAPFYFLE